MALPASRTDPPPQATTQSTPRLRAASAPARTSDTVGSPATAHSTQFNPADRKDSRTGSARRTSRPVTSIAELLNEAVSVPA